MNPIKRFLETEKKLEELVRVFNSRRIFQKVYRISPITIEFIGKSIINGSNPNGHGIKNEFQYRGFRSVYEKYYKHKLPEYKEALSGPLFAGQDN